MGEREGKTNGQIEGRYIGPSTRYSWQKLNREAFPTSILLHGKFIWWAFCITIQILSLYSLVLHTEQMIWQFMDLIGRNTIVGCGADPLSQRAPSSHTTTLLMMHMLHKHTLTHKHANTHRPLHEQRFLDTAPQTYVSNASTHTVKQIMKLTCVHSHYEIQRGAVSLTLLLWCFNYCEPSPHCWTTDRWHGTQLINTAFESVHTLWQAQTCAHTHTFTHFSRTEEREENELDVREDGQFILRERGR